MSMSLRHKRENKGHSTVRVPWNIVAPAWDGYTFFSSSFFSLYRLPSQLSGCACVCVYVCAVYRGTKAILRVVRYGSTLGIRSRPTTGVQVCRLGSVAKKK